MATVRGPEDRWAWVEIDLGAVKRNVRSLKKCLGRNVQLMCAVKADAYGHGAVRCSQAMLQAGANQLAVATVHEGVELREAGIDAPILMLNDWCTESALPRRARWAGITLLSTRVCHASVCCRSTWWTSATGWTFIEAWSAQAPSPTLPRRTMSIAGTSSCRPIALSTPWWPSTRQASTPAWSIVTTRRA